MKNTWTKTIQLMALAFMLSINIHANPNATNNKETYVLVHSAALEASSFNKVKKQLERKGHKVVTCDLANAITMDAYVKATQKVIDTQDTKVILVGHGFSGIVISATAQTRSDKVKSLVYLAGMLVPNDNSFLDLFGTNVSALNTKPTALLEAKINISNDKFGTIPRYYIQTLNDNTIPTSLQKDMYSNMGIDKLYTINDSDHLVIISKPTVVANILDDVSRQSKLDITSSEKSILLKAVLKASNTWKDGFNTGKASQSAGIYAKDAIMNAKPFGTFKGRDAIEKFWDNLIKGGYSDVEYINATIDIIDNKHAVIASSWKMNKAKGIITKELFQLQEDGSAKLIDDNFEVK